MNRFLQMLGIAAKAGKAVSGEFAVEQAIKGRSAYLVIIATDASANTKKHFSDMCAYRSIPIIFACDKIELGRHTGKAERASIGITDQGIADKLISTKREV